MERDHLAAQPSPEIEGAGIPWPSRRQAWWAVFVFGVTLAVSYIDRGVVNLLVQPIKHDVSLTDTQVSLLMGFAFVALYLVVGLPVARWVDSGNRRFVLGAAATVWSLSTMLCGLAGSFVQLALCRVGVGAGEAVVSPAISSMISDLFPRERLARAMSLLGLAYVAGNGLALLLGGLVVGSLTKIGPIALPLVGVMQPWQATFVIVGLPGLVAAALYLTVKEPVRRGAVMSASNAPGLSAVLAFLWRERVVFGPMFLALALNSMVAFGAQSWMPAFFERSFGWAPQRFGAMAGTLGLILNPIGILIGFRVSEWFQSKGRLNANLRLVVIVCWIHLPLGVLAPLAPSPYLAMGLMILAGALSVGVIGSLNAAFISITPNRMRAQVTALYLVMYNVIGYGLGPTLVALVTDYGFRSESRLNLSLALVSAVLSPLAALAYTRALKPYTRAAQAAGH